MNKQPTYSQFLAGCCNIHYNKCPMERLVSQFEECPLHKYFNLDRCRDIRPIHWEMVLPVTKDVIGGYYEDVRNTEGVPIKNKG